MHKNLISWVSDVPPEGQSAGPREWGTMARVGREYQCELIALAAFANDSGITFSC